MRRHFLATATDKQAPCERLSPKLSLITGKSCIRVLSEGAKRLCLYSASDNNAQLDEEERSVPVRDVSASLLLKRQGQDLTLQDRRTSPPQTAASVNLAV